MNDNELQQKKNLPYKIFANKLKHKKSKFYLSKSTKINFKQPFN